MPTWRGKSSRRRSPESPVRGDAEGSAGPAIATHARLPSPSYNYGADALFGVETLLNVVHAAAENTSTLATMTGDALISTP